MTAVAGNVVECEVSRDILLDSLYRKVLRIDRRFFGKQIDIQFHAESAHFYSFIYIYIDGKFFDYSGYFRLDFSEYAGFSENLCHFKLIVETDEVARAYPDFYAFEFEELVRLSELSPSETLDVNTGNLFRTGLCFDVRGYRVDFKEGTVYVDRSLSLSQVVKMSVGAIPHRDSHSHSHSQSSSSDFWKGSRRDKEPQRSGKDEKESELTISPRKT